MNRSWLRGALLVSIVGFFMPWGVVSCDSRHMVKLSGLDLMVGKTIDAPSAFGSSNSSRVQPHPTIGLVFVAVLCALGAAWPKRGRKPIQACAGLSASAAGLIVLQFILLDREVTRYAQGMPLEFSARLGFYASLVTAAGAALLAYQLASRTESLEGEPSDAEPGMEPHA